MGGGVLQDIVAVGYGGFSDKDAVQGVVCCWSLKNCEVLCLPLSLTWYNMSPSSTVP